MPLTFLRGMLASKAERLYNDKASPHIEGELAKMTTAHIIILLATGMGVGFASGLLGVGGAFIMTPVQYMVFTSMGVHPHRPDIFRKTFVKTFPLAF